MSILSIVLKLNIKGSGDSLVWSSPKPLIKNENVERYFPRVDDKTYGPNIGLTSDIISHDSLFLTTTSTWNSKDEFRRPGISLSQGLLINVNPSSRNAITEVCTSFEHLLRIHKVRYEKLGGIIDYVANKGNMEDAQKLASELLSSLNQVEGDSNSQIIQYLATRLRERSNKNSMKLQVDTRFPWSEELGVFALIGLQLMSEDVQSIAGGNLMSFAPYQHIATAQEVPGFSHVDLNDLLSSQVNGIFSANVHDEVEDWHRPDNRSVLFKTVGESVEPEGTLRKKLWDKLIIFNTFSPFLILCLGIAFIIQQRQLINRFEATAGKRQETRVPIVTSETRPSSPTNVAASSTPQGDQPFLQTISQLYSADRNTRITAIAKLSQDTQSHERIVPLAIEYALTHSGENGIGNTLLVLQKCNPAILKRNNEQVTRFIEMINTNHSRFRPGAERLRALITQ